MCQISLISRNGDFGSDTVRHVLDLTLNGGVSDLFPHDLVTVLFVPFFYSFRLTTIVSSLKTRRPFGPSEPGNCLGMTSSREMVHIRSDLCRPLS